MGALEFYSCGISEPIPSLRAAASSQVDVDVLLAREAQQFLDALLTPDAGLLVAAERRAEEMLRHLVDHTKPASTAAAARCAVARSLVQIEQVSPYSTWLTSASIFSASLHFRIDSTGPKISSLAMRMSMVTSANTVGST